MIINYTTELASYIGDPYWPEIERLVNITKESGMSRARSSANRRKALEEYLRAEKMSLSDYEALEQAASRPFYTDNDEHIKTVRGVGYIFARPREKSKAQ